jgi:hypothetical protein
MTVQARGQRRYPIMAGHCQRPYLPGRSP